MRFASTAIILKEPLLVILASAFLAVTVCLSGWIPPNMGFGVVVIVVVAAAVGWFAGSSEEVVIDPSTRVVTHRYRLLNYVTAENTFAFADFTGVRVARTVSKHTRPTGYANSPQTRYEESYVLSLLRANTQAGEISVPHYPLELPMDKQKDAREIEEAALQVARLGRWPAKRRGYAWASDESTPISADFDADSEITSPPRP